MPTIVSAKAKAYLKVRHKAVRAAMKDLNLDGLVDAQDYGVIDNWVQFPGTNGYANGDINYDGVIDAADYGIIDHTIQLQGPPISVNPASADPSSVTAVPEPSGVVLSLLPAAAAAHRRRMR